MKLELPKLDIPPSSSPEARLNERTLLSLHIVVLLLGVAVWLVKLGDKIDADEKTTAELRAAFKAIDNRLYHIETRLGLKKRQHDDDNE